MPVIFYVRNNIIIPAGAIIPLIGDVAAPDGWSIWSDADDKYIIGAGDTYAPSATGAGDGDIDLPHTTDGAHMSSGDTYGPDNYYAGPNTAGGHTHPAMLFTSPAPNYTEHKLIKANTDISELPPNACLLKDSSGGWANMTRHTPDANRFFKANSTPATGGKESGSVSSAYDAGHDHGGDGGTQGGSGTRGRKAVTNITHQHIFTADLTFNLKKFQLSLWYNASSNLTLSEQGYIIMYESATPPNSRWSLCNGSNGTPDLRNYFINVPTDDGDTGNYGGTGNVTCTSVTNTTGAHSHNDGRCNSCPNNVTSYHYGSAGNHYHTIALDATWLPPYYALAFMKYTG